MPTLLHLDSSADRTGSVSRTLTARFAAGWTANGADHAVVRRDLHADPLPHLATHVLHWAPHLRRPDETVPAAAEDLQRTLIDELLAADVVVVGAPMYNWSLPSTLKAWVDNIHVPGTTAPFGDGPQPMAGRPVVIVSSRGAQYGPDTANAGLDHEIPALQQVLGVALGMSVYVVTAELTLAGRIAAMAPLAGEAEASLAAAEIALDAVVARLA
ncbi:FMN-dependent NADH-azoreductase [Nakamurella deserti]|uniref:FMN-dependent NADH-azoreductase n=1 Tax=Nakamurella deserti TaxID=2164074 RepID=UPI000DBE67B7|nr:NAD(P)H-dependent oxidoreductase [Nakamurella deserti]